MQERLQKLGQAIAKTLWQKHRNAGSCRLVVCLAELALDIAEQDEFSRGLLRAAIASLEQLRDSPRASCIH